MKDFRRSCLVFCLLFWALAASALRAEPAPAAPPATVADPWFRVTRVGEGVWRIDDRDDDNAYLIAGETGALLVDATLGRADLARCVAAITPLPVTVVVTHGHRDHAGGIGQFERVHVHPADLAMAKGNLPWGGLFGSRTKLVPVQAGFRFDLGHRTVEVIETPGHTPGSICLLDREHRLLFTGDNNNGMVWLFLRESLPLADYLATLRALNRRAGEFDALFPGHGTRLDAAFIGEQITCIESILAGTAEIEEYRWYGGTASLSKYRSAMVAFDLNRLQARR